MDHSRWLQEGCRLCGGRLGRYKVSYDCHTTDNKARLLSIGVLVEQDEDAVHPRRFCHGCYNVCVRMTNARAAGKHYTPQLTLFHWVAHSDEGTCTVCHHFRGRGPGRKPKKMTAGRPPKRVLDIVSHVEEKAPESSLMSWDLRSKLSKQPSTDPDLMCPVCRLVLDRPMLITTCNKLVCMACCVQYTYKHTDLSCPCCGPVHTVDESTLIPASSVILKLLGSLELACETCHQQVIAGMIYRPYKKNY